MVASCQCHYFVHGDWLTLVFKVVVVLPKTLISLFVFQMMLWKAYSSKTGNFLENLCKYINF